jgi:hypothetical protein
MIAEDIINDDPRRVKQTMLCSAVHTMTCCSIFSEIRVPSMTERLFAGDRLPRTDRSGSGNIEVRAAF